MGKKLIILLSLITLIIPAIASADVISIGEKRIGHCIKIENINAYSDYTFIANFNLGESNYAYIPINANSKNQCVGFPYYSDLRKIYAIKTSDFNRANLEINENDGEIVKERWVGEGVNREWLEAPSYKPFVALLTTSPYYNLGIKHIITVSENDPREGIADILKITTLSDNNLIITKSKVIYTYTDGTSEEKVYQNQDIRPEPSRKPVMPWWIGKFWYIILPIIALLAIITIIIIRKVRK